jgi:hypothetical protein
LMIRMIKKLPWNCNEFTTDIGDDTPRRLLLPIDRSAPAGSGRRMMLEFS